MKIKKITIVIISLLALLALLAILVLIFSETSFKKVNKNNTNSNQDNLISAQYTDASLFLSVIKQTKAKASSEIINGLIVPHHLLAKDIITAAFAYASANNYKNIVLLSPDHFQAGKSEISVTERSFSTVFGIVETNKEIVRQLKELSFVGEGDFFYREHGLQAQLPFIKYYFPQTKIIAITFKPTTSRDKLDKVIAILEKNLPPDSLIIQSTDFSHYLNPAQAAIKDSESINIINNENTPEALNLKQPDNIDSAAALYVQTSLQKDFFKTKSIILEHKNSQDYTAEYVSSSTSYFSVAYQ